jgi:hypothetical protein
MPGDWSASEKKLARRAFDEALNQELAELMRAFKAMAAKASDPADMWATEQFLSRSRQEIDSKYDYRYSQLEFVFGQLLREGRITREQLSGLHEEKLQTIFRIATL